MRERPILFSAPMVRAILAGTKTQTRRVVKPQPHHGEVGTLASIGDGTWAMDDGDLSGHWRCPYGQPGDRLWVKEAWGIYDQGFDTAEESTHVVYRADSARPEPKRWRSPIFMSRWASRIDLGITGVRVERLHDISEADATAEGVEPNWCGPLEQGPSGTGAEGWLGDSWIHYGRCEDDEPAYSARESYESLWKSINGAGSWDENPWVWIVEFRRVES